MSAIAVCSRPRGLWIVLLLGLALASSGGARAADTDGDGIDDLLDNCPFVPNADQADVGGLGRGAPDGIGDACQCSDVDADGRADVRDVVVLQRDLAGRLPQVAEPTKCSGAGGRLDCDLHDVRALREGLAERPPGVAQVCEAASGVPPLPLDVAACGDSITQAFAADCTCNNIFCLPCPLGGDQPEHSWFDGWSSSVYSLHDRYLELDPGVAADKSAAVDGARMVSGSDSFSVQADLVLAQLPLPEVVVVELGGNDLCSRECIDPDHCAHPPYDDAAWTAGVRAGLDKLVAGLPLGGSVYLLGVPRVQDLRQAGLDKQASSSSIDCEAIWEFAEICLIATQADPLNGETLAERLAALAERQRRYNEILRDEAFAYTANTHGRNPRGIEVVADYASEFAPSVGTQSFGPAEINGGDCFHPSVAGQNLLGALAWNRNPRH